MQPAELARRIFLASGEGPGPVAVRVVQRARGTATMLMVECMGRSPAVRLDGVFASMVDHIDPTEENVFIDFGDLGALREHLANEARAGLALCEATRDDEASAAILECAVRLLLWLVTFQERRALDLELAMQLIRARFSADHAALVQAHAFGRLAQVVGPQHRVDALKTFFGQQLHQIGQRMRADAEAALAPVREVEARLLVKQQRLQGLREQQQRVEGGSCNPEYFTFNGEISSLMLELTKLREQANEVQRQCQLDVFTSAGRRRRELYSEPAVAPQETPQEPPPAAA